VAALVAEAERVGGKPCLATLLMLDAGLRLGEATALSWEDVGWEGRVLRIRQSLSRGKHLGNPKSGRERRVAASRRLLSALREAWMREGRPESGFVAQLDHANYRNRTLGGERGMLQVAGLDRTLYTPHSLRDTYASQLLTAGVQLGYISRQLGHADVAITARHYARWCGDDAYRRPLELAEGEVPADLLARLGESHQSPTIGAEAAAPA
jgi:integrase